MNASGPDAVAQRTRIVDPLCPHAVYDASTDRWRAGHSEQVNEAKSRLGDVDYSTLLFQECFS